jgi:hypothetical protein
MAVLRRVGRHRPKPATVIAIVALLVAVGGVAVAAIPDSNGVIHGCYRAGNGDLRVVDPSASCRKNERALSWNQQGPSGTVKLTRLHFSDVSQASYGTTYALGKTVGSFTKGRADTTLRVTWQGIAANFDGSCEYQLRVDGKTDAGSAPTGPDDGSGGSFVVPSNSHSQSVHTADFFDGVGPGEHSVSIWIRHFGVQGFALPCYIGPYEADAPKGQDVFVEEIHTDG